MRSDTEMLTLIRRFVTEDDNIRAAVLNGSRALGEASGDPFRDYDVACFARDVGPYIRDRSFLDLFGERMITQTPDAMGDAPQSGDQRFAYLMQFADGNRIDLTFYPLRRIHEQTADSLTRMLVDKDHRLDSLPQPGERDYLPQPPTAKAFADCCNEFWWVAPYVAKGLWRGQLPYVKGVMEGPLRQVLMEMLRWVFGVRTGWRVNPGGFDKHLRKGLDAAMWAELECTWAGPAEPDCWEARVATTRLFRRAAGIVAGELGFDYPTEDDRRVSAHLRHVRRLPKDATEVY